MHLVMNFFAFSCSKSYLCSDVRTWIYRICLNVSVRLALLYYKIPISVEA